MGLIGHLLRGQMFLDSTAIVGFLLSARGLSALFFAAICFYMIRMMEQAGLSVLTVANAGGANVTPGAAFKTVIGRIVPLLQAAARVVASVMLMVLPLLIAAGLAAHQLLSRHDINYYLAQRPTDFLLWAGTIALIAVVAAAVLLWNALKWRWLLHVILFENKTGSAVFTRSAHLARGAELKIGLQWGGVLLLNVLLGVLAAWIGRLLLPLGIGLIGDSVTSLGVLLGGLVVLQAMIGSLVLMAGPLVEDKIFTRGYLDRSGQNIAELAQTPSIGGRWPMNFSFRMYALMVLVLATAGGVVGGIWGAQALTSERPVLIIAHRAAVKVTPENSIPAIERAIKDGADVAEIDVQLSRDGVVIVCHDSDFSRVAGVAKKVADLTWAQIQAIDIGTSVAPQFARVHAPRLEDVLVAARDQIHLNIELKHYAPVDEKLETQVVDLIHRFGNVHQIEMQSLEYDALMAVRRMDPTIKIGYLMSMNARNIKRLDVDFLSVQASRVDARFLWKAHRNNQVVYVWTVDTQEQMERMMDMGVDGIITNNSSAAAELRRARHALSSTQLALQRMKTWLAR